jgi:DNA topoisomerase-3
VLEEGWKVVESRRGGEEKSKGSYKEGEDEDQRQAIPLLEQGQEVHIKNMDVVEKETKPPRPYTDATLLAAMKNAGREIEDDELAEAMKESGLGTPATRAETIEKLIRTGYVLRDKKSLNATEKAKALIGLVAEQMRSPELTAEWEQQLKEVEDGQRPVAEFYEGIAEFVRDLVPKIQQGPALSPEQAAQARAEQGGGRGKSGKKGPGKEMGPCPKCKEGKVAENAKAYGCSRYREGCDFTIWKTVAKKKLSEKQAKLLMANGRTEQMKGFTSKAGKKFDAKLKFDDNFKVVFEFDDGPRNGAAGAQAKGRSGVAPGMPRREGRAPVGEQGPPPYPEDQEPPPLGAPYPEEQGPPPAYGDDSGAPASNAFVREDSSSVEALPQQTTSPRNAATKVSGDLSCPKCNQGQIIEGKRGFGCNRYREGCDFVVWKEIASKKLTEKQIQTLIAKGKTGLIKGFKSRKGSKFDARLKLDEGWKTVFDFAD